MTGFLEHAVELLLHFFPDSIAVRLDYHTSAHCRLLGKVGFDDQVVIPLRVIVGPLGEVFEFYCHKL